MIGFKIPYGKQHITSKDIQAVVETLQSDFLTQGPKIQEFEEAFASYVGADYAVAVANGTAALHLCAIAANIKEGDKVITTPITFAASANCIRYCGGEVVFADIDPETYLLDIGSVRRLLEKSAKGTYKGIIPVDFAGRAVDLEAFRSLANEFDLWIIEDACHAPGGYFMDRQGKKRKCGSGDFADMAIFSFHPVKHIAAGEGGMITTNNFDIYKRLLSLRSHGITRDSSEFINDKGFAVGETPAVDQEWPGWYMEMQELGFNYRLTDFQSALALSQLERADEGLYRRREIAHNYSDAFTDKGFVISQSGVIDGHAYHLYILMVEQRFKLYNYLRANNVFAQIHYIPTHLMPYYRNFGWKEGDLPYAENYYKNCISLPIYPSLSDEEQNLVTDLINKFYN